MQQKNYITPQGLEKLKSELRELRDVERPEIVRTVAWAASNGDRSENADYIYGKRRLREIDRRIEFLVKRLEKVIVINPGEQKSDKILFGATVTLIYENGEEKVYSIVGEDEADIESGRISWRSPLAQQLLNKSSGDSFVFRSPGGEQELEITNINYVTLP